MSNQVLDTIGKRIEALALAAALGITSVAMADPMVSCAAQTITVHTQKQLNKALKKAKKEKSKRTILIKTKQSVKLTIKKGVYKNTALKIVSSRANIENNARFSQIQISDAKTVTERGYQNRITSTDKKLTLTVDKKADKTRIVINRKNAGLNLVVKGKMSELKLQSAKKVVLKGTGKTKLPVSVNKTGAQIQSYIPLKLSLNANAAVILKKGAERTSVCLNNPNISAEITNQTQTDVVVSNVKGETTTLRAGVSDVFSTEDISAGSMKETPAATQNVPPVSVRPDVSEKPTTSPSAKPAETPTEKPTTAPSVKPAETPTEKPTMAPSAKPAETPTEKPTMVPSAKPAVTPTEKPTMAPSAKPTATPTEKPTTVPSAKPTVTPTEKPTTAPSAKPAVKETEKPTATPTEKPTTAPSATPSPASTPSTAQTKTPEEYTEAFNNAKWNMGDQWGLDPASKAAQEYLEMTREQKLQTDAETIYQDLLDYWNEVQEALNVRDAVLPDGMRFLCSCNQLDIVSISYYSSAALDYSQVEFKLVNPDATYEKSVVGGINYVIVRYKGFYRTYKVYLTKRIDYDMWPTGVYLNGVELSSDKWLVGTATDYYQIIIRGTQPAESVQISFKFNTGVTGTFIRGSAPVTGGIGTLRVYKDKDAKCGEFYVAYFQQKSEN